MAIRKNAQNEYYMNDVDNAICGQVFFRCPGMNSYWNNAELAEWTMQIKKLPQTTYSGELYVKPMMFCFNNKREKV